MRARAAVAFLSFLAIAGCRPAPGRPPAAAATVHDAFWDRLSSLCGQAFPGRLVEGNASDSTFRTTALVMHVRQCTRDEIRIPFHAGSDRSRTWVLTRTATGLRLKHDHRHEDGSEDRVTQYGGDTRGTGTAERQDFHADAHTAALIPAAAANVWTVEVVPGGRFAYALRREGTDRRFRVEFDLARPVPAPPAPWGERIAPTDGRPADAPAVGASIRGLEEQAATRVADAVCDKRLVLLGELPEHGEARGFGIKARIVEQLVTRCGFDAVLFEAGSYDFFGLERAIAGRAPADSLELALARAIGAFWWTRELAGFRSWLLQEAQAGRVALGGIDDQPSATAAYARATLPVLVGGATPPERATECREAVARYLGWGYTTAVPYDAAERARLAGCARLAAEPAQHGRSAAGGAGAAPRPDEVMLADIATYFARERANAERDAAAAPDRDLVMAQHVAWWAERLPRDAKIVVWTATTHAARAPGAQTVLSHGATPLGARLAESWGNDLAAIGFTALQGVWARARGPAQPLAPLPAGALETRALAAGAGDWVFLDRAALRSIGAVPSRLFGPVTTFDWSTAFDGVLVIREEIAPTFEERR